MGSKKKERKRGTRETEREKRIGDLNSVEGTRDPLARAHAESTKGGEGDKPPFYGRSASLQIKDALDAAFNLGNHVQSLWSMYLVASVAVVGWAVKGDLAQSQKLAVLGLYIVFCAVNGVNLLRMYKWLNAVVADLKTGAEEYSGRESRLHAAMLGARRLGNPWVEGVIYGLVFATVFFMVAYSILSAAAVNAPK